MKKDTIKYNTLFDDQEDIMLLFFLLRKSEILAKYIQTDLHRKALINLKYHLSKSDLYNVYKNIANNPRSFKSSVIPDRICDINNGVNIFSHRLGYDRKEIVYDYFFNNQDIGHDYSIYIDNIKFSNQTDSYLFYAFHDILSIISSRDKQILEEMRKIELKGKLDEIYKNDVDRSY